MRILNCILSIPKTIYLNFKVLPLKKAYKLPILVSYKVSIKNIQKNKIVINGNITTFMIKIGFGGSEGILQNNTRGFIKVKPTGVVVFNGKASFATGISIRVDNGRLNIGRNFSMNKSGFISCTEGIDFGDDVLIGWNCSIRDSDGHKIYKKDGTKKKDMSKVSIGNNIWICSNVNVLKGVKINDGCVIAYGSLVTHAFDKENCIIGGCPARLIEENISWER